MSIATGKGDHGTTNSTVCGLPTRKSDQRIEAYGTIDELNSLLGVVRSLNKSRWLEEILQRLQRDLFVAGADLATPLFGPKTSAKITPRIKAGHVAYLEEQLTIWESKLTPLRHFILPTGNKTAAQLHLARAVCRRAERCCVALANETEIGPEILRYFNRLSDLLFILARTVNKKAWRKEKEWIGE